TSAHEERVPEHQHTRNVFQNISTGGTCSRTSEHEERVPEHQHTRNVFQNISTGGTCSRTSEHEERVPEHQHRRNVFQNIRTRGTCSRTSAHEERVPEHQNTFRTSAQEERVPEHQNTRNVLSWQNIRRNVLSWQNIRRNNTPGESSRGPQETQHLVYTYAPESCGLGPKMSASVSVTRSVFTEERFQQTYGTRGPESDDPRLGPDGTRLLRARLPRARLPIFTWLPRYRPREWLLGDSVAGLTVGVLHIPQGMAFALLTSVAPVFGSLHLLLPGASVPPAGHRARTSPQATSPQVTSEPQNQTI
ncbi:hypothetical protein CRUP_038606, partial [Coryphaenoides rupestris]